MNKIIPEQKLRPSVDGKFLRIGEERFYIKGVTYGTFAPDALGDQFPSLDVVDKDFQLMSESGINTVRTYTVPTIPIFDLALKYNLKVMVGLPWEQHLAFLESKKQTMSIVTRIKELVTKCDNHPAILSYSIGNEIPARTVRWYSKQTISNFLHEIYQTVKKVDPEGLVTYVNYPTTEYLHLPFLDFDCFNIFLENEEKLSKYLARLHNITGDKPLVLAEIGLDSMRNGQDKQAEVLKWQLKTIFERGCAGAFVFAWTDDWWRGGAVIEDWEFGLVDRYRKPKPALNEVINAFRNVPFTTEERLPKFSVVVCSYNGAATIQGTLEGLKNIDYPEYEIIVVDDGSKDDTANIAREFDVRLISTENEGLSSARNTGLLAATGEIIAYIDDDAHPDPQWLRYLASLYLRSNHAGIGGPNIPPLDDGPIASCVANAPGGPVHVLYNDEIAEHIPGCNMSFRRDVLMEIGGFDPVYRTAGDDVDICWRVQQKGYTIGFHPAAFVWHHCRNSISRYWNQQKGYGKAEALLQRKWPEKYNVMGHLTWTGRLYGNGITRPLKTSKEKIFYGHQGTALFQSVYQPAIGFYRSLPLMPEWYLLISLLALLSLSGFLWSPLFWALPFLAGTVLVVIVQACQSASNAIYENKYKSRFSRFKYWSLISVLHVIQPVARLLGRIKHGLIPWRGGLKYLRKSGELFFGNKIIKHWSEKWKSADEWLLEIKQGLTAQHNSVRIGGVYDQWDIQNKAGLFASVQSYLTIEEHGMGKQYLILKRKIIFSKIGLIIWLLFTVLAANAFLDQALLASIILGILATLVGLRIIHDAAGGVVCLSNAMRNLSDGIDKELTVSRFQPEETSDKLQQVYSIIEHPEARNNNGFASKIKVVNSTGLYQHPAIPDLNE